MPLDLLATLPLGLLKHQAWLWPCRSTNHFLAGDAQQAFLLLTDRPGEAELLVPARKFPRDVPQQGKSYPTIMDHRRSHWHPLNLPIPDAVYDAEFAGRTWRGLCFLPRDAYDSVPEDDPALLADLLGTVFGGHGSHLYVQHRASGLILSLAAGSLRLLRRSPAGFALVDEARPRGRNVQSFAAHPLLPQLAYGDNYGDFFLHEFSDRGFGKARKIDGKTRAASTVEFVDDGQRLLLAGMGYLSSYVAGKKYVLEHEVAGAVRDLTWNAEHRTVLVNRGMHGVTIYRLREAGFVECGRLQQQGAIQQLAVSRDMRHLATTEQDCADVRVYRLTDNSP